MIKKSPMAFVPDFKYDIFISYAQIDNDPLPETDEGWVTTLVKNLTVYLRHKLGEEPSICPMDQKNGEEQILMETHESIKETAILCLILSPGYEKSERCTKEKKLFLENLKHREESRFSSFFIIEKGKLESSLAEDLSGIRFISFLNQEGNNGNAKTLGFPKLSPEHEPVYYDRLNNLSCDLRDNLILKKRKKTSDMLLSGSKSQTTIFLAEVTDDLLDKRDKAERFLTQEGFHVLPEKVFHNNSENFSQLLISNLEKCDAFIQLLSEESGKKTENIPEGVNRFQYEQAQKKGLPIFQWCPLNLEFDEDKFDNPDQIELLNLETVKSMALNPFLKQTVNELKKIGKIPQEEPESKNSSSKKNSVFIDTTERDEGLAKEIKKLVLKREMEGVFPSFHGTPREKKKDLVQKCLSCDALIVVYGKSPVKWVKAQIRIYRDIRKQNEKKARPQAVYLGPPKKGKPPINSSLPGLDILDCQSELDEKDLVQFLNSLPKV